MLATSDHKLSPERIFKCLLTFSTQIENTVRKPCTLNANCEQKNNFQREKL
uniref:Uncharacterized protein n=1 Tax=Anguilla anguilla TaxID=7936 RepID=A0A0E9PT35_ANGAN